MMTNRKITKIMMSKTTQNQRREKERNAPLETMNILMMMKIIHKKNSSRYAKRDE